MKNKRCKKDAHSWVCQEFSGELGEVVTIKPLDSFALQTIIDNPDRIKQICSRGNIVCEKCQAFFLPDKTMQGIYSKSDFFTQLKNRLIK